MMYSREDAQAALNEVSDLSNKPFDYEFARCVIAAADVCGATIAAAESITGGLVSQLLTLVPGASHVFVGGVVAYSSDVKTNVLGVSHELIERGGSVQADVALAMAQGVADRLNSRFGVACTGVAGPTTLDNRPVGEVHIAVVDRSARSSRVHSLKFAGTREEIREQTAVAVFGLLLDLLIPLAGLERPIADTPESR